MDDSKILVGDCREVMTSMAAESVDAIVTDPPYGLSFMGKGWDHGVPGVEFWTEALRVAKPGAHLLAFGGTRTYHRLACAIEDAGWEIRDCVMWVYGSGFPKSHDISKAIDKAAGAEREVVGRTLTPFKVDAAAHRGTSLEGSINGDFSKQINEDGYRYTEQTAPATDAARQWSGWGTALKPAWEPIIVARKPLVGTVAANVLRHGTGAINVDGCRIEGSPPSVPQPQFNSPTGRTYGMKTGEGRNGTMSQASGRWPANLIHDGSDEVVGLFPVTRAGEMPAIRNSEPGSGRTMGSGWQGTDSGVRVVLDSGSAARFFYCAKASKADRDEGLDDMEKKEVLIGAERHKTNPMTGKPVVDIPRANIHPTVKPTELMRYLCRLVTPPGGLVLDPFCGSGSTGKAAILEGFRFVGIEQEPDYASIANARIAVVCSKMGKRKVAPPREGATLWD